MANAVVYTDQTSSWQRPPVCTACIVAILVHSDEIWRQRAPDTLLVLSACDCCVCRAHSYCWLSFDLGYDLSFKSLQVLFTSSRCITLNRSLSQVLLSRLHQTCEHSGAVTIFTNFQVINSSMLLCSHNVGILHFLYIISERHYFFIRSCSHLVSCTQRFRAKVSVNFILPWLSRRLVLQIGFC